MLCAILPLHCLFKQKDRARRKVILRQLGHLQGVISGWRPVAFRPPHGRLGFVWMSCYKNIYRTLEFFQRILTLDIGARYKVSTWFIRIFHNGSCGMDRTCLLSLLASQEGNAEPPRDGGPNQENSPWNYRRPVFLEHWFGGEFLCPLFLAKKIVAEHHSLKMETVKTNHWFSSY